MSSITPLQYHSTGEHPHYSDKVAIDTTFLERTAVCPPHFDPKSYYRYNHSPVGENFMSQVDTFVIVPTYNEADNLDDLLTQLLALPVPLGVIVVDDNSPDGTGQLADKWADAHSEHVHVIHRPGKMGLGTAYIAGFQKALHELEAKRIMTMDADFSHNPRHIPAMIEMSEKKHLVIGSRYVPGGGSLNCTWKRMLLSRGANMVARGLLGLKARDTTAGFRLYRREVLTSIPLEQIFSSGYSFLVEMLFMCQRRGWQVGEVPILFEDRRKGQTKISRQEIIKAQYTILRLFIRRLRRREPRQPTIPVSSL
jgi:dolichol-phosphate mannosyltransferase